MVRSYRKKGDYKPWSDALRMELSRETETDGGTKATNLSLIAKKVVELAKQGDAAAIREVGQRLDGQPPQAIQHSVEDYSQMNDHELHRAARENLARSGVPPKIVDQIIAGTGFQPPRLINP